LPDGSVTMALAVYGKHPAKGDFLEYGLPAGLRGRLETWLDGVLAEARNDLGPLWEARWSEAPYLRFWLGEAVWGDPVCGVMVATQDRVGRRFPLVILASGAEAARRPPPSVDPDQGWYDRLASHLAIMLARTDLPGPSALLDGVAGPPSDASLPAPGTSDFWAARPDGGVDSLWADVALTDHRRAAAGRSYWWIAGPIAAAPVATEPLADEAFSLPVDETEVEGEEPPVDTPDATEAEETATAPIEDGDADTLETTSDEGAEAGAEPELETLTEAEPDAVPEPAADEEEAALWSLPVEMDDDSPFASSGGGGLGLFAPPAPPSAAASVAAAIASAPSAAVAPMQAGLPLRQPWSQVWAGPGLPSGAVIAWFLRGFDGNG
jgi:type VI secretion system ImpM family protein